MSDLKLKQCPFCGSSDVEVTEFDDCMSECPDSAVQCNYCFSNGAKTKTENHAVILWNMRVE